MDERASRRAALIAAILAIGLLLAWWSTRPEHERAGDVATSEADAGAAPASHPPVSGHGDAPPKPNPNPLPAGEDRTASAEPWSNEQPPPDYVGEPSDAGRPLPTKAPRADYDVVDDEELDARRRETIDFLNDEMAELERAASRADESGDSALATSLRQRRARMQARRDTLAALVEP